MVCISDYFLEEEYRSRILKGHIFKVYMMYWQTASQKKLKFIPTAGYKSSSFIGTLPALRILNFKNQVS